MVSFILPILDEFALALGVRFVDLFSLYSFVDARCPCRSTCHFSIPLLILLHFLDAWNGHVLATLYD